MTKPTILVDADEVLCGFTQVYLDILNKQTGRKHTPAEVTDFDFKRCVANEHEDELVWSIIHKSPGLVRRMRWLPGAAEGLNLLRELGHVVCVTSPSHGPHWVYERTEWLMHCAGFKEDEIVFTKRKELVRGRILIDDRTENVASWCMAHRRSGIGLLLAQPHNRVRPDQLPINARRVAGWTDALTAARYVVQSC